jgi:2-polyprenyl-3-methyl-5-hydroxy-6-metoxy-1,4-benzoquinol methylase
MRGHWNHNTHYHRALLRRLPSKVGRALDVGCGDGRFARQLAACAAEVVAIDIDPREVEDARRSSSELGNIHWECADLLTYEPGNGVFDAITALAVIHHVPLDAALTKMQRLLAPGGRLLVLGLWPSTATATDIAVSAVASVGTHALQVARGPTSMSSPVREAEMPLRDVRRRAAAALPGATVRRKLLWRYLLEWTKPPAS